MPETLEERYLRLKQQLAEAERNYNACNDALLRSDIARDADDLARLKAQHKRLAGLLETAQADFANVHAERSVHREAQRQEQAKKWRLEAAELRK